MVGLIITWASARLGAQTVIDRAAISAADRMEVRIGNPPLGLHSGGEWRASEIKSKCRTTQVCASDASGTMRATMHTNRPFTKWEVIMARKYGKKAGEKVRESMHEFKRGELKSG